MNGKGSKQRPRSVSEKVWSSNYDQAFRKKSKPRKKKWAKQ